MTGNPETVFCPKCGGKCNGNANFCEHCGFSLRADSAGESVSVGGNVGPGAVAGSGKVEAENIAGRDVIKNLLVQIGVDSELELEKVLRSRLFVEGGQPNRDDVERWVEWHRARSKTPDLVGAKLAGLLLDEVDLTEVDLRRADLSKAGLSEADLGGANLRRAKMGEAVLVGAILWDANLLKADLRETDLGGAILSGADLRGVDLSGAYLDGVDLNDADLEGATMPNGEIYTPGMDLSLFGTKGTPKAEPL